MWAGVVGWIEEVSLVVVTRLVWNRGNVIGFVDVCCNWEIGEIG